MAFVIVDEIVHSWTYAGVFMCKLGERFGANRLQIRIKQFPSLRASSYSTYLEFKKYPTSNGILEVLVGYGRTFVAMT